MIGLVAAVLRRLRGRLPTRVRAAARRSVFVAISPLFRGDAVHCPCCGRGSRRWVRLWLDAPMCPHCSSMARNRLLLLYLRNETPTFAEPTRLLHFAPEPCLVRVLADAPTIDYLPADLDPHSGAARMDITAIPLEDASVDLAIASHVLEHIPDDRRAMAELRRVVRAGGTALLMVPMEEGRPTYEDPSIGTPEDRLRAFGQEDHVRIYGDDFTDRLREAGFEVRRELYARTLGSEASAKYGLQDYDAIYVCA